MFALVVILFFNHHFSPIDLPAAGQRRDRARRWSPGGVLTSEYPWRLLNRWYANHMYAKVLYHNSNCFISNGYILAKIMLTVC
jgi:hypothetical protein